MNKVDLLNSTLNELAKDLKESLDKLHDPLLEKIHEELPHMSMLERIKLVEEWDGIERGSNKAMLATCGASRAERIIAFLEEDKKKEAWSDPSVMGGKTDAMPDLLKVEQVNRPKDGKDLDAWIKDGKAPNDTGPIYSGKNFENEKITQDGNLIHKGTGNSVPQLYVGSVQQMNGAPDKWVGKPIKFLGRRIWAFNGRGYGHEVEVEGQYGILSLNGATDKKS